MKITMKMRASLILFAASLSATVNGNSAYAQNVAPAPAQIFRLDGGNTTYAFSVNERGELQPLYWGGRVGAHDPFPAAHSYPELASFDSPYTTTPQEYASWGAGLYTHPALKVTIADGNLQLALRFVQTIPVRAHT